MTENKSKGPQKDAAKLMTEFRKKKQEKTTVDQLKKAIKNWPQKDKTNQPKKIARPDAEV